MAVVTATGDPIEKIWLCSQNVGDANDRRTEVVAARRIIYPLFAAPRQDRWCGGDVAATGRPVRRDIQLAVAVEHHVVRVAHAAGVDLHWSARSEGVVGSTVRRLHIQGWTDDSGKVHSQDG